MAAHIAQRLSVQEQEIRRLNEEIGSLLELGLQQDNVEHSPNPALEQLRAENEKLKYRILHLQRSLREEQGRARPGQGGREHGALIVKAEEQHRQDNDEGKEKRTTVKGENSVGGKQSACQVKGKSEKKNRKEVDGLKQEEETTQDFSGLARKKGCPGAEPLSESGGKTDFLQLIHRREYWDIFRRPWKVIFPLEDDLTENASSIILVRLDEHRDIATQEQLENLSDPNMPRWLHKHDRIMYKSPTNTWKILYQDPLPDKYLLYLKKDNTPVKFSKDKPTKLHSLSHHLLK